MAKLSKFEVKTCEVLLREYTQKRPPVDAPAKLTFTEVGHKDVYNITAPFEDDGEPVIAGRVESRDSEHSEITFFVERDGRWVPREGAPTLTLQDPFFTRIDGELVLGGVQIYPHPTLENMLTCRTVFYKGKRIAELEPFFKGPDGMKDLRLVQLRDGGIGVFTRPRQPFAIRQEAGVTIPSVLSKNVDLVTVGTRMDSSAQYEELNPGRSYQGDKGGRGKIGFSRIPSLAHLTLDLIDTTPLLAGQFIDAEWGGANEPRLLSNGLIGVLGHIASFDNEGNRHYYSTVFALDPETGEYSDMQLIAVRADFLPGASKRSDLADVVFSGGLVGKPDGTADLYAGISDAEAHRITIPDPFLQYER